jgi:hypothetical protein
MQWRFVIAVALCVSPLCWSCFPYYGATRSWEARPIEFVDDSSGKLIPEVLVVPVYARALGVGTSSGEGPSSGGFGQVNLRHLFVHQPATFFPLTPPKSFMVIVGPGAVAGGVASTIVDLVVIAPGYKPYYVDDWSLAANIPRFPMSRCALSESQRWLADFERILSVEKVTATPDLELLGLFRAKRGGSDPGQQLVVEVQLDADEQDMLRRFFFRANERLAELDQENWETATPVESPPVPTKTAGPLPPDKLR